MEFLPKFRKHLMETGSGTATILYKVSVKTTYSTHHLQHSKSCLDANIQKYTPIAQPSVKENLTKIYY
jgi:hypothetical protein